MKACFPIVGEKEYKDSTLRTEQRQCVFTNLRVESVFISFVSFSFNKRHVSVPTRTSIRARVRSACKKLFVSFGLFVFKTSECPRREQNPCERNSCSKISCKHLNSSLLNPHCGKPQQFNIQHSKVNIAPRAIRVPKLFVKFGLFVFKNLVQPSWQYF